MSLASFNHHGVWSIYRFEMSRFLRTVFQSLMTPVITTSLYFVVFGSAIGSRMSDVNGISYGAFIVPGLIMLSLFSESISNGSFGIHIQKCCRRRSRRWSWYLASSARRPPSR